MKRFQKFMYGRYGVDEFYSFLFKVYILLFILNMFLNLSIISYIEILLVFYMFFRVFSKNIYKRSNENVRFLKLKKKILRHSSLTKIKDNDYVYKKCKKCHTILRLPIPYERGIKNVKCPKCGNKNRVLVLRKQKVEIIKNKK